jgi:hypothetical protein
VRGAIAADLPFGGRMTPPDAARFETDCEVFLGEGECVD